VRGSKPKVAVIGAGIVGASIAYHLAARGAAVTLIDRTGAAAGVTAKAFAWINVSHGQPEPYQRLRHQAIADWRRLERALGPALAVDWCGALTWTTDPARTERFVQDHAAFGYDVRLIERAEIARLEPNLIEPPALAAIAASEGAVDPIAATRALVSAAQRAGAVFEICEATEILADGTVITGVKARGHVVSCDVAVLAAGTGSTTLLGPFAVRLPVLDSPAILLRFRTQHRLVNRIVSGPQMEVRHGSDGRLWCAEDHVDDAAADSPDAIAAKAMGTIERSLRQSEGLALESVDIGLRPIPADDLPIVGFTPQLRGLYAAIMHAGVTLAPVIGRLAASEILEGTRESLLESCRPARFHA
jgi:glycine/D-amino acid oxidase-like deaminating enzyme